MDLEQVRICPIRINIIVFIQIFTIRDIFRNGLWLLIDKVLSSIFWKLTPPPPPTFQVMFF